MDSTGTRAFPRRDAQYDRREAVRSGLRLPYQERIRLKKLAQRRMNRRQQKVVTPLKVGTLNVGTLTGRGMELVDMMERRKINVLCLQETKWKGQKAREMGNGYKLYYNGVDGRSNGVEIVLDPELKKGVLSVSRESDQLIWIKKEINKVVVNVVSAYAPQQGCDEEEKEEFWDSMDEVMEKIPGNVEDSREGDSVAWWRSERTRWTGQRGSRRGYGKVWFKREKCPRRKDC